MAVERVQKRVSGAAVRPISPQWRPGCHGTGRKFHAVRFLCVWAPPADGWRGPPFFTCIRRWGYLPNREYICSRQAGTCSCGCLAAAVAPLGKRERSGDVVDPFCGSSQQQQRRSRRQRRRWRHLRPAAAARRRRDGQGLDNTGCGQSAIWAHGKKFVPVAMSQLGDHGMGKADAGGGR